MAITPVGFTAITADYTPFQYPPEVTGLEADNTTLLINGSIALIEAKPNNNANNIYNISSSKNLLLSAQVDKTFLRPGDSFSVTCTLSNADNTPLNQYLPSIILCVLNPNNDLLELPATAYVGNPNSAGVCIITGVLGQATQLNVQFQFVAYVAESQNLPLLITTTEIINKLFVVSNLITITVLAPSATVNNIEPPVPPYIAPIPLHDALISNLGASTTTQITDNTLSIGVSSSNANMPTGSTAEGIYSNIGVTTPSTVSLQSAIPSNSIQMLLGSTVDYINRIGNWAQQVLQLVHSSSIINSEVSVIKNLSPSANSSSLSRYLTMINDSGKYTTDLTTAASHNYANGNSVVQNNAVLQHTVGQYRVQSASICDINSPSFSITSQHMLLSSRFYHLMGDLHQESFQQIFLRAEDGINVVSSVSSKYTTNQLFDCSAKAQLITGKKEDYSDTVWEQVGQVTAVPLHLTNSNSTSGYGTKTSVILNNYNLETKLGNIVFNSAQNTQFVSLLGGISLSSKLLGVSLNSNTNTIIKSNGVVSLKGGISVSVSSGLSVIIKGGIVFINSGSASTVTDPVVPTILTTIPKVYLPMVDVAPYIKQNPISPRPISQQLPNTPLPNLLYSGSPNLGPYLTNSQPQSG